MQRENLLNQELTKLLIRDEASKVYEYLHEFRDSTQNNTGIILTGVEYLKSNMETLVDKSVKGMPEIYK